MTTLSLILKSIMVALAMVHVQCWQTVSPITSTTTRSMVRHSHNNKHSRTAMHVFGSTKEEMTTQKSAEENNDGPNVEEATEKYGLEVGLFQSLQQKDGGESAKSLLKKYGIAYLATSIPLALVSFGICFVLVDNGVDVASLLGKIGIESSGATEKAGTFAIAYAAHKAASPIRFPPTVLLTPVVANLIGKEPNEEGTDE
mmetsp:Transcript_11534/g.16150  ORF Transcript_11534/g.16150 Transcript_11534/m.16150 type:complete len:200 (-) Transcript_11534:76-675(-)